MADSLSRLEVGRIGKAHGIRGEVVVTFTTDRPERHTAGAVLNTDDGDLIVASSRPHQGKQLVSFQGVTTRTAAETLVGRVLLAEPIGGESDTLWVHELVGCTVVESGGTERGMVVAIEANPASDLLVLDDDTLVPLHFVVDGPTDGVVTVDAPRGLFDLDQTLSERTES